MFTRLFISMGLLTCCLGAYADEPEILALDVIAYEDFTQNDPDALEALKTALHEKGIVGIRGVPGYREKVYKFIETARKFSALPEEVKETYAPNRNNPGEYLGYEKGKEKFKRPDGRWVVDDLKVSYYDLVPDSPANKWPTEIDLKTDFEGIGMLMAQTGTEVMQKIGLIGANMPVLLAEHSVGRMLYYRKSIEGSADNPFWCGAHFDHGMFTALLPAFYFSNGESIPEPIEAGLFVKTTSDGVFKKVVANDPEVMLFQVGEFGQLVSDDEIRATEHRVHKALGAVERYTMALFFSPPMNAVVYSTSELTEDARYGDGPGCSFEHWHVESLKRYYVKD